LRTQFLAAIFTLTVAAAVMLSVGATAVSAQASDPADESDVTPATAVPGVPGDADDPDVDDEPAADDLPTTDAPPSAQTGPVGGADDEAGDEGDDDASDEPEEGAVDEEELDPVDLVVAECQGIEATIVGTPGNDMLVGTSDRDIIFAGAGNDRIQGGAGDDIICGAGGDDIIDGGAGFDWVVGGAGDDRIRGNSGSDMLLGGPGDDILAGGPNRDVLIGNTGDDFCRGGRGNDRSDLCEETLGVQTLAPRAHAALELLMMERINTLRTSARTFDRPEAVSGPIRSVKRVGLDKDLEAVSEGQAIELIEARDRVGSLSEDLEADIGPDPDRNALGQIVFVACGPIRRAELINQMFFAAIQNPTTFESLIVADFENVGVAIQRGNGCWYTVATFTGNAN